MVDFNYLKHNESEFPHLGNVDVFKYDNDFDYGRFDATQMELQICTVPWDVGEAHIGNRTISGIGNVVYFETKEKRNAWFDAIPDSQCYRFTTKFKELHRSLEIDVPIPYDMCAKHNYLVVRYAKFANENSPVEYEGENGLREWFWFIREVEFLAPNTTRLHLLDDAFQTWIYDINISGMVLERGHAPLFAKRADAFLANPVDNCEYLLTEDVNYGNASIVKHIEAVSLNDGDMYACIATTANPAGDWGSKGAGTWKVPGNPYYTMQGQPSVYVFAMPAGQLNTFLSNISSNVPQFKQTVQGVFFASSKLVTLGSSFSFGGVTCYALQATRKNIDLFTLSKSQFGYPARYADMAKLYTSPYAHIEVTDENGNADVIKIEDSTGTFKINAAMNIAYPFVTIDAHLSGVGGNVSKSVTFQNITSRSMGISGQWYETIRSWGVPMFAVVLDPTREYDYSTHFDRVQRASENLKTRTNAYALADTAKTNADNQAATIIDNADLQRTMNTAVALANKTLNTERRKIDNSTADAMANASIAQLQGTVNNQIDAAEQSSAISEATTAVTSATSAIASIAKGDIAGGISTAVGGAATAVSTMAQTAVGTNLIYSDAEVSADFTDAQLTRSKYANEAHETASNDNIDAVTSATNAYTGGTPGGSAGNTAATMSANAANDKTTQRANASRDYNTAQDAIANDIAQAALRSPFVFGAFENGDSSTTRPMAVIAHVVTQSKAAIAAAGDEFARYGYMFDRQWAFNGNWNIGKYFTYWKLRDFWVYNLNVPDMYMDKIRFFLFGGVTVWRSPEYIGKIDIYDNF